MDLETLFHGWFRRAFGGEVSDALAPKSRAIGTGGLATGGGDLSANRTITVPVASQAEAEAGTVTDKAMTPQRTAQAIAALGVGGGGGATLIASANQGATPTTQPVPRYAWTSVFLENVVADPGSRLSDPFSLGGVSRFTAGVDGVYVFQPVAIGHRDDSADTPWQVFCSLSLAGTPGEFSRIIAYFSPNQNCNLAGAVIMFLSAGQYVDLQVYSGDADFTLNTSDPSYLALNVYKL